MQCLTTDYAQSEVDRSEISDVNSYVTDSYIDHTITTSTSVNFSDTRAFLDVAAVVNTTQVHDSDESDASSESFHTNSEDNDSDW